MVGVACSAIVNADRPDPQEGIAGMSTAHSIRRRLRAGIGLPDAVWRRAAAGCA
jgi:hypothetical protein